MILAQHIQLRKKYRFLGRMVFKTAFRIGSGRAGESGSDMGVLLDPQGTPILPGSSLKGKFRSTVERLAYLLGMDACLLNKKLSQVNCVSDIDYFTSKNVKKVLEDTKKDCVKRYQWLVGDDSQGEKHVCDVCQLFGSPLCAGRIFFQDGNIQEETWCDVVEHRDGVVIDRDSERAVDKLKYDYEVIPAQTAFDIRIEVENPSDDEIALITAGICEWKDGIRLGGGVSRGLGMAELADLKVEMVDFQNPEMSLAYFLKREMTPVSFETLQEKLGEQLQRNATAR